MRLTFWGVKILNFSKKKKKIDIIFSFYEHLAYFCGVPEVRGIFEGCPSVQVFWGVTEYRANAGAEPVYTKSTPPPPTGIQTRTQTCHRKKQTFMQPSQELNIEVLSLVVTGHLHISSTGLANHFSQFVH